MPKTAVIHEDDQTRVTASYADDGTEIGRTTEFLNLPAPDPTETERVVALLVDAKVLDRAKAEAVLGCDLTPALDHVARASAAPKPAGYDVTNGIAVERR